jgi:DnaJ family protein C protein 3
MLKKEESGDRAGQEGRHTDAITSYNEALAVDPSHTIHNIKIQIKHCNSLIQSKQFAAAITSCSHAIDMDNSNIDAVSSPLSIIIFLLPTRQPMICLG